MCSVEFAKHSLLLFGLLWFFVYWHINVHGLFHPKSIYMCNVQAGEKVAQNFPKSI